MIFFASARESWSFGTEQNVLHKLAHYLIYIKYVKIILNLPRINIKKQGSSKKHTGNLVWRITPRRFFRTP